MTHGYPIALSVVLVVAACGGAPPPRAEVSPGDAAPSCRMMVVATSDAERSVAEAVLARARPQVERCRGPAGAKLDVRVRTANGKLAFDVEPGSSLSLSERRCVLDALSPFDDEESTPSLSTGATVAPTGFTSLLRIEW